MPVSSTIIGFPPRISIKYLRACRIGLCPRAGKRGGLPSFSPALPCTRSIPRRCGRQRGRLASRRRASSSSSWSCTRRLASPSTKRSPRFQSTYTRPSYRLDTPVHDRLDEYHVFQVDCVGNSFFKRTYSRYIDGFSRFYGIWSRIVTGEFFNLCEILGSLESFEIAFEKVRIDENL